MLARVWSGATVVKVLSKYPGYGLLLQSAQFPLRQTPFVMCVGSPVAASKIKCGRSRLP